MLKQVTATRYITPLREGGSLPGLVEADDFGTYVMKFTGAGQGRKTLVAEVICGELARPLAFEVSPEEAGRVLWFDALINNVDRSWRNPNLLVRQGELWLIDHGATMIWHHNWPGAEASAARPYDAG